MAAAVIAAAVACGVVVGGVSPAHAVSAGGTPDATFSSNIGSGFDDVVRSVAVQADGKVVIGGGFTSVNGVPSSFIARLNAGGTPDTAFSTNTGTGFNGSVDSVAVQADAKILVGGFITSVDGVPSSGIARLNTDGTPDTAFSTNTGTGFDGAVLPVAVQADGKVLVGGDFTSVNGVTRPGLPG